MAFQPIVNITDASVFAHEALVRGTDGRGAGDILGMICERNRYAFDQACRVRAIELASAPGIAGSGSLLSINFLPNAIYEPKACIRPTLAGALQSGFWLKRTNFEFTVPEKRETAHLLNILRSYLAMGFLTAIDKFGAGYSSLGHLSKFHPGIVKIDMELICNIDADRVKRLILGSTLHMLRDLGIRIVFEGIHTAEEPEVLREIGVELMQGFFLARPSPASLTPVSALQHLRGAPLKADGKTVNG